MMMIIIMMVMDWYSFYITPCVDQWTGLVLAHWHLAPGTSSNSHSSLDLVVLGLALWHHCGGWGVSSKPWSRLSWVGYHRSSWFIDGLLRTANGTCRGTILSRTWGSSSKPAQLALCLCSLRLRWWFVQLKLLGFDQGYNTSWLASFWFWQLPYMPGDCQWAFGFNWGSSSEDRKLLGLNFIWDVCLVQFPYWFHCGSHIIIPGGAITFVIAGKEKTKKDQ